MTAAHRHWCVRNSAEERLCWRTRRSSFGNLSSATSLTAPKDGRKWRCRIQRRPVLNDRTFQLVRGSIWKGGHQPARERNRENNSEIGKYSANNRYDQKRLPGRSEVIIE